MLRKFGIATITIAILAYVFSSNFAAPAHAQAGAQASPRITQPLDESKLVTLAGNTRPEAISSYDRGAVPDDFAMEHMLLLLQRSPEQEQELKTFVDQLHNPNSPNFHRWVTAQEFGDRFGLAQQDLDTITWWLQSKGFTVNVKYPSGVLVDFSGTAGQVRAAFHTEIHNLNVNGSAHVANMTDPQIPAALKPVVAGIVSLNNFMPHPLYKPRTDYTAPISGTNYYIVTPSDLATIYNLNPLFTAGTNGAGQTVVLIEDTNLYTTTDINTFRSTFGLPATTVTTVHPGTNCSNPGTNGADGEAALDVEYAGAAAPGATLEVASCADTTTFGGLIAFNNLISESSPPAIYSVSYGECEADLGSTANAAYNSAYEQAVSEGLSVFVSSGDEGAASCDADLSNATHGIAVSGFSSTPYNVSVGGTDFGDSYAGTNSSYWNSTNTSTYGSAKSYVPEIPWNDSCASVLIATIEGYSTTYGTSGFCNSTTGKADFLTTASGSGGPSSIYAKPSWQSLVGNPSDGVRDLPDVSLFAANGVWGHFYVFCWSDTSEGGTACTGAPSGWAGAGGTSFASPIMAGIQALVNQKTGAKQGNPNTVYYSLAATEYGSGGNSSCNSTLGNGVGSSCIFYDVTQGDMDVNCTGTKNCYKPSGTYGVLSTSTTAYAPAYGSGTGWDFATGIGTLNAANLVNAWPTSTQNPSFTLASSPSSVTITQGGAGGTSSISLTALNGFTGSASLVASGLPTGVTVVFNPTSVASGTPSTLTLTASATATTGGATVTITGTQGSLTAKTTVSLNVNAAASPSFTLASSPTSVTITQGGAGGTSSISLTALNGFTGSAALTASGLPSGVTAVFNPTSVASGSPSTLTLTASATATTGTSTVTIKGTQGSLSATTTVSLTVNASAPASFTVSASPTSLSVTRGSHGTTTITINKLNGFSGNVTLSASGEQSGVTAAFSPNPATGTSTLTLTASSRATVNTKTVTIKGVSGSLTKTSTISLTIVR